MRVLSSFDGIKENISTKHSSEGREVADKLFDCFTKGDKLDQGHILEDVLTVQGCQNDRGQFWRGRRGRRDWRDCWAFDGSGRAGESGKHITQSGHFWRFARENKDEEKQDKDTRHKSGRNFPKRHEMYSNLRGQIETRLYLAKANTDLEVDGVFHKKKLFIIWGFGASIASVERGRAGMQKGLVA